MKESGSKLQFIDELYHLCMSLLWHTIGWYAVTMTFMYVIVMVHHRMVCCDYDIYVCHSYGTP